MLYFSVTTITHNSKQKILMTSGSGSLPPAPHAPHGGTGISPLQGALSHHQQPGIMMRRNYNLPATNSSVYISQQPRTSLPVVTSASTSGLQAASTANLSTLQAQAGASAALHPQAVPAQGMSAAVVPATRPVMVTVDPSRHSSLPSHAAQQLQHAQSNLSSEHPTKG